MLGHENLTSDSLCGKGWVCNAVLSKSESRCSHCTECEVFLGLAFYSYVREDMTFLDQSGPAAISSGFTLESTGIFKEMCITVLKDLSVCGGIPTMVPGEGRGQYAGVRSLLPPCGFQDGPQPLT